MRTLYKNLSKLNIPFFSNEYDITSTPLGHHKLETTYLSNEMVSFLGELNLYASHLGSFRWEPNTVTPIHTDNKSRGVLHDTIKLNYIVGGKDSKVNWYIPIDLKTIVQEYLSPAKRILEGGRDFDNYTDHDEKNCVLIKSASLSNFVLMQAGIPHNVINPTEERYCFTIVLNEIDTKNFLTMEDGLRIFSNYI